MPHCGHVCVLPAYAYNTACCMAGDVDSITIGGFTWSCSATSTGSTNGLGCMPARDACSIIPPFSPLDPTMLAQASTAPLNGTLPDAIGRLSCRSKITRMCAPYPARMQADSLMWQG